MKSEKSNDHLSRYRKISPIPSSAASFLLQTGESSLLLRAYMTECGPLEKGMANYFTILALRTP